MAEDFYRIDDLPTGFGPCALTIGNFDGVHRGHQAILKRVVERAKRLQIESVALTFEPHPLAIVAPGRAPQILTTVAERTKWITEIGIDRVVVLPFTVELSRLTPEQFVRDILVERLAPRHITVGDNFRFGHRHLGDVLKLQQLGAEFGFETEAFRAIERCGGVVSSSRVRDVTKRGAMRVARRLLGRPFSLTGEIVRGEGIGAKQTVPTINLAPRSQVLPADGVYISVTKELSTDRIWESITNVGKRPTFEGKQRTVETFLLGDSVGIFPEEIELYFLRRIRAERRFESAEQLKAQILTDVRHAERYFTRLRAIRTQSVVVP